MAVSSPSTKVSSYLSNIYIFIAMIRLTQDTSSEVLNEVKENDMVTDTFSKTGLVESIAVNDDGLYKIYEFHLVTGRTITIKK